MRRKKKDPIEAMIKAIGAAVILTAVAIGSLGGGSSLVSILGTVLSLTFVVAGLALVGFVIYIVVRARKRKGVVPQIVVGTDSRASAVTSAAPPPINLSEQLRTIDWFQFEKLMEVVYRKQGYTVNRGGGANPDGGIDLVLERGTERVAVQCKHWKSWKVGVPKVRELLGSMTIAGIPKGILVTISGYTGEAKALACSVGIQLVDTPGVLEMLAPASGGYDSEIQACLNSTLKLCPKCESEMVLRTAKKGTNAGSQFWGCSKYPDCRSKLQITNRE